MKNNNPITDAEKLQILKDEKKSKEVTDEMILAQQQRTVRAHKILNLEDIFTY